MYKNNVFTTSIVLQMHNGEEVTVSAIADDIDHYMSLTNLQLKFYDANLNEFDMPYDKNTFEEIEEIVCERFYYAKFTPELGNDYYNVNSDV